MTSEIHQYTGTDIVVRWDETRCIHSERCLKALPTVFDRAQEPWVQANASTADEAAAAVEQCPTGALQYRRLDGGREELPDATPSMVARPPGPIIARGDLQIETLDGEKVSTPRAMLCGCGVSATRPFCDGTHRDTVLGASRS